MMILSDRAALEVRVNAAHPRHYGTRRLPSLRQRAKAQQKTSARGVS